MSNSIDKLIELMAQVGTPIEEHAAKIFALRDEFILYVRNSNHSLEWFKTKLDRYSVQEFMGIVKEAKEQGKTFEDIEAGKVQIQQEILGNAFKSLIAEWSLRNNEQD